MNQKRLYPTVGEQEEAKRLVEKYSTSMKGVTPVNEELGHDVVAEARRKIRDAQVAGRIPWLMLLGRREYEAVKQVAISPAIDWSKLECIWSDDSAPRPEPQIVDVPAVRVEVDSLIQLVCRERAGE